MGKILLVLFALYMVFATIFPRSRNILAHAYLVLSFVAIIAGVITGYWW